MNKRQGMNSRPLYNQRAFSPSRMNSDYQSSSNYGQQQSPFGNNSSNAFGQSFFQYRNSSGLNDIFSNSNNNNQNSRNDSWPWDDIGSRRNQMQSNSSQNYQGGNFGCDSGRNQSSSNFPSSSNSNFGGNYGGNSSSSYNSSSIFSLPSSSFNSSNFSRSSGNQSQSQMFDIRDRNWNSNPNDRDRNRGRNNSNAQQNSNRNQKPFNNSSMGGERQEKYPDIGEPKIRPRFEDAFELKMTKENGVKMYSCRVCKIPSIPEKSIKSHIEGKKHKYHLKMIENSLPGKTRHQKEKAFKEMFTDDKSYTHTSKFDRIINDIAEPLVALEFLVEILNSDKKEPFYICTLCDKNCDPRMVRQHLLSPNHRMKYLSKFFLPIATLLQNYRRFREDIIFKQATLTKIAERIESRTPRTRGVVYEGQDFDETKKEIIESIENKSHFSITDLSNAEEVLLEGINLNDTEWLEANPPKPPRVLAPVKIGEKRKRKIPEAVLAEYRTSVALATKELQEKLKKHIDDPDSHPMYKDEWEQFWKRKVDEMSKRGEDPTGHHFHDEWCEYFLKRIHDLHDKEVTWTADKIRKKMGLILKDTEDGKREKTGNEEAGDDRDGSDSEEELDKLFSNRKGRFYVSDNDDDGNESFDEDYREHGPRISKDVLYVKEEKVFNKFLENVGIDKPTKTAPRPIVERKQPVDRTLPKVESSKEAVDVEPTSLVITCRLLSTLEMELGLLAPKVLDLLSKAVKFERENSKPADELLFDSENLNLVETVKEKILGMQSANLITNTRMNAVEKAIGEIYKLIDQHEIMLNVKKTLKEMGKDESCQEEVEMLKAMFRKKTEDFDMEKRKRMRGTKKNAGTAQK